MEHDLPRKDNEDTAPDAHPEIGVEQTPEDRIPVEELDESELEEMVHGNDPESGLWSAVEHELEPIEVKDPRSAFRWTWHHVRSDGFALVVSLLALMGSLGMLGLAIALGETAVLLPVVFLVIACVIWTFFAWRRWLACAPYVYRLLTSLGENAEQLLGMTCGRVIKHLLGRLANKATASSKKSRL